MKRHVVWCTVRMHWMMMPISSDERWEQRCPCLGWLVGGGVEMFMCVIYVAVSRRSLNFDLELRYNQ